MQGNIQRNARGIVVLVVFGARDNPGQTDGIEKSNGAVSFPRLPKGVFQRFQQQAAVFRRICRRA